MNTTIVNVEDQKRGNAIVIEGVVFSVMNNQPCRDKGWYCLTVSKAGWTGTIGRDFPKGQGFETITADE